MDFVATIEKTRRDLLELTARNRLVHTPLESKRRSWIPIEDERSDQLFDLLVRQGKTMTFLPGHSNDAEDDRQEFIRVFDDADEPEVEAAMDEYIDDEVVDEESLDSGPAARHTDLFLQTRTWRVQPRQPVHLYLLA